MKLLISLEQYNLNQSKKPTKPNGIECPRCGLELHDSYVAPYTPIKELENNGYPIECVNIHCGFKGKKNFNRIHHACYVR